MTDTGALNDLKILRDGPFIEAFVSHDEKVCSVRCELKRISSGKANLFMKTNHR